MRKQAFPADAIHGNKSQNHRERVLAAFRTGEIRTLVATDIAARGIDVDGITHVFNSTCRTCRNLRPSHRPHRARRRGGHRHLAGGRRRKHLPARHRKADQDFRCRRKIAARRAASALHLPPRSSSDRPAPVMATATTTVTASLLASTTARRHRRVRAAGAVRAGVTAWFKPTRHEGGRPENARHEQPRTSHGNSGDGIQGVAFLHRESLPAQPQGQKRNQRPHRS